MSAQTPTLATVDDRVADKKKPQVPTPPRSSKTSSSGAKPTGKRRTGLIIGIVVGALVVAGVVVGIVVAASGGGGGGGSTSAASSGCSREEFASQGREHTEKLSPDFEYNSTPATSGPHYPTPAVWNVYTEPVEEIRLVHNLEHGGIVVQYGDKVSPAAVDQILEWYQTDPNGILVAPRPDLGATVAVTAWTQLMACTKGFDEAAFTDFRDDYRFKGPEAFPPEALAPGTQ